MAAHLARIHGTEEDKVNCPFYYKIGACRHSDRCSRLHHKPAFSPTLLVKHLYRHPQRLAELQQAATAGPAIVDHEKAQEDFLVFYEDLYMEFSKFGRIDALHVCDNLGDHMIGHVYCKFTDEEDASDALQVMNDRYYDGRKMEVEFSPVQNFQEARCRDFDEENCARGGFCNFMHVKPVPLCLVRSLEEDAEHDRRREEDERKDKERDERRARKRAKRKRRDDRDSSRKRSRKSSRRSRSRSVSSEGSGDDDDDDDDRSYEK
mmetsp:Transcript_12442/g.34023  ORF Transcript_12442/g.34023 Transcript_12442/m.34023 type:complete len:263 (-) Transcript_12442:194-982(-)